MNLFNSFVLGTVTFVAILAIISICLPRQIHIQREVTINAPAAVAFEQISNLRNWPNWLPGHHIGSEQVMNYAGPPGNMDARLRWKSQRRGISPGVVTIVSAEPHKRLVTSLEFKDYDKARSTFTLEETSEGTKLTWHFEKYMGNNPFRKFSGLLIDSTVGEEFEDGLENIKREAEAIQTESDR